MPKVSNRTAAETVAVDGFQVHMQDLDGGYTVCFEEHGADADWPAFRGLPDERCQVPRWG